MRQFRKGVGFLCLLLSMLYFTSYICRLNFSAAMAEMIDAGVLTKADGGLIGTALFVTYGLGQIISGALSDRFSPSRIILAGLFLTVVCNLLMPLVGGAALMAVVWGVNGFAQALFWPPMASLMVHSFNGEEYARGVAWVSVASHAATILIYVLVSACIALFDWRSAFLVGGGWAALFTVMWILGYRYYTKHYTGSEEEISAAAPSAAPKAGGFLSRFLSGGMVCILVAVMLQGYLKDGIQSWMPTFFTEVFDFSAAGAILSNALLPIFNIIVVALATSAFSRIFRDELKEAAFLFFVAAMLAASLLLFKNVSALLTLLAAALITGSMHGINLMLISFLPRRYLKEGRVATVTGICNACSYIGSAISSYGIALVAEHLGWNVTLLSWVAIAALGALLCLVAMRSRSGRREEKEDAV